MDAHFVRVINAISANEVCAIICENLCHLWLKTTPPQAEADHFEQVLCNETIFESALRAR